MVVECRSGDRCCQGGISIPANLDPLDSLFYCRDYCADKERDANGFRGTKLVLWKSGDKRT